MTVWKAIASLSMMMMMMMRKMTMRLMGLMMK
jgi:hypothetical protein